MKLSNTMLYEHLRTIYYPIKYREISKGYSAKLQLRKIKKNSIVFVTHELGKTGAVVLLLNIMKTFQKMGIDAVVISMKMGELLAEFEELTAVFVCNKNKFKKLLKCLSQDYNCKYIFYNSVASGMAVRASKKIGFIIISLVHEMNNLIESYSWIQKRAFDVAEYSDYIIFPSNYVKQSFLESVSRIQGQVIIRNQGIFNNLQVADEKTVAQIVEEFAIPPNKKVVLNVGTPEYRKGFDIFVNIAVQCAHMDEVFFVWVGGSDKTIISKKNNITNMICVDYISDNMKLAALFQYSYIFLLTSREDPFPSVILQALYTGTPVIAFDKCGGFVDVINNSKNGYLIEPFKCEDVVVKINELIGNKSLYDEMSMICKSEASKHDFDKYCEFLLEFTKLSL